MTPSNNDGSYDLVNGVLTVSYDSDDYLNGMSGGQYIYNYKVCIPNSLFENCEDL